MGEAKVRARGTRGQNWYTEKRVSFLRSKVRTQSSWLLHLAGDFHVNFETKPLLHTQHLIRCMLTSNLAVDQRFANGTRRVIRVFVSCVCVWVGAHTEIQTTRETETRGE